MELTGDIFDSILTLVADCEKRQQQLASIPVAHGGPKYFRIPNLSGDVRKDQQILLNHWATLINALNAPR
jgi:hypothetical protein